MFGNRHSRLNVKKGSEARAARPLLKRLYRYPMLSPSICGTKARVRARATSGLPGTLSNAKELIRLRDPFA